MNSAIEISEFLTENRENIIKITFSSPKKKDAEYSKITVRPITIKGSPIWQAERFRENKVFHLNVTDADGAKWLSDTTEIYAQISVFLPGETVTFSAAKTGYRKKSTKNNFAAPT